MARRTLNEEDFKEISKRINEECDNIIADKGKNYHREYDVLSNFKKNGERIGITKYQSWADYWLKHIDAITNSISDNPLDPTIVAYDLKGNICDAINYLKFLAALMYEEGHQPFGGALPGEKTT